MVVRLKGVKSIFFVNYINYTIHEYCCDYNVFN